MTLIGGQMSKTTEITRKINLMPRRIVITEHAPAYGDAIDTVEDGLTVRHMGEYFVEWEYLDFPLDWICRWLKT